MKGLGMVLGVLAGAVLLFPPPASGQLSRCKARVGGSDGVIAVKARGFSGQLLWGESAGSETNAFSNEGTCGAAAGPNAARCTLGDVGPPPESAAITPPRLCTIYLRDQAGAGDQCSAHIKGCTPGVRGEDLECVEVELADTFSAGTSWNRTPECPTGKVVTGGGYQASELGVEWSASRTYGSLNAHFCQGYYPSGADVDVKCLAQCCKGEAVDCIEVELADTFSAGTSWNRTPACPAGRVVTGGGHQASELGVEWQASRTYQSLNAHFCQGYYPSGPDVDVKCLAQCCK